jgi:DNA-binding NarL/FixJ family response regulator
MTNRQALTIVPVMMMLAISRERRKRREAAFRRYWKGKKLCSLTNGEREAVKAACSFTPDEEAVFNLKADGKSIVSIAMRLNMSEASVNRRIRSIKRKIYRTR